MDLSRPIAARDAEPLLDHRMLVVAAAVRQASTRTARLAARIDAADRDPAPTRALVVTFLGTDPAGGAHALGGSFHPRVAPLARTAAIGVNRGFTLAF